MSNLPEVSQNNFQSEVLESKQPVIVDFGAVWCGPCKMLDPVVEELADEWNSKVKFVKIDVDHNSELAMQFSVMGVPTLMLFIGGQPVERMSGYKPRKKIVEHFQSHL